MLRKIVAIKNVGRFRNSAGGGDTSLARHTVIHGANGYGKTTICTILRALSKADADLVLGRATLGATEPPDIHLLMESGNARFDGRAWAAAHPDIAVFDNIFVSENVHSGDIVDTDQKRGLYRVIVGEAGVDLAEEEAALAGQSRTKTSEITQAAKAIQSHVPAGMKLNVFVAIAKIEGIEAAIAAQEARLAIVGKAATIQAKPTLARLVLPVLPEGLPELLSTTIDDIAQDAEQQIATHIARHNMGAHEAWITQGLEHAGDTCPFCGEATVGLPLISAYRAVFAANYKALRDRIATARSRINQIFGEAALARLVTFAEQHGNGLEFWSHLCHLDPEGLAFPFSAADGLRILRDAALALVDKKDAAPLEPLALDEHYLAAASDHEAQLARVEAFNRAVYVANEAIAAKKTEAGDGNVVPEKAELERLRAIKIRHDQRVDDLCVNHAALTKAKADLETRKGQVRQQLDDHTASMVTPYQMRINELLDDFNAGFKIAETRHSYAGGVATSSYHLVINRTPVDIGANSTPHSAPSFRNTLSAGDRSTLALAFFIAHLERNSALDRTIVVLDDPFNSQDSFRRMQTVHEIMKLGSKCAQVIVMSHDATFLKQIWDKCRPADRAALGLVDHGDRGSKIAFLDLEKATRGRTATDTDHLLAFYHTTVGEPVDIVRKMRTVLETYLRITWPSCFGEGEWLGEMVGKIRDGGLEYPAAHLYDKLNEINDSAPYHHGENLADATPDQLDPVELKGLVKRTLRITNALQA